MKTRYIPEEHIFSLIESSALPDPDNGNIKIFRRVDGWYEKLDDGSEQPILLAFDYKHLILNVRYNGNDLSISSGEVLESEYLGSTYYRHISISVDTFGYPIEDAFYTGFDGVTLSNKIAERHT